MEMAWHLAVDGQTRGPYTAQQLGQALAAGQINPQTLVWSAGLSGWQPLSQTPQLAAVMGPPPAPPAPPK